MKDELSSAWLILWQAHGTEEEAILKRHNIRSKFIDILGSRKTFEQVSEHVENLYKLFMLSSSEKLYVEHYTLGGKRKKEIFGKSVPRFSHFGSDLYRKLALAGQEDMSSPQFKALNDSWGKYPEYVSLGHNPSIEAKKVFNLNIVIQDGGEELLSWEEPLVSGERKKMVLTIKQSHSTLNIT